MVESNVLGTLNVLQACRAHGCRMVHTSTSEVYGTALRVPIDEDHPLQGQSPYSASKIGADKLVESYYRAFDVDAVTLRPFNTYGPGQSARAVIPTIITGSHPGCDPPGKPGRTGFTYLSDGKRIIKQPNTRACGETINLGYGAEVSIGERPIGSLSWLVVGAHESSPNATSEKSRSCDGCP